MAEGRCVDGCGWLAGPRFRLPARGARGGHPALAAAAAAAPRKPRRQRRDASVLCQRAGTPSCRARRTCLHGSTSLLLSCPSSTGGVASLWLDGAVGCAESFLPHAWGSMRPVFPFPFGTSAARSLPSSRGSHGHGPGPRNAPVFHFTCQVVFNLTRHEKKLLHVQMY